MTEIAQSATSLANLTELIPITGGPRPLVDLRRQARDQFRRMGLPSRRDEAWRFTNIGALTAARVRTPSALANGIDTALIDRSTLPGYRQLVLLNGRLVRSSGGSLPKGVVVCGLAEAIRNHPRLMLRYLGQQAQASEHPFVALNTTAITDGSFLLIPPAVVLDEPIQILHVSAGDSETIASFPRSLVVAGAGSSATVIESHVGESGSYLSCPVSEIFLGAGATLDHFKLVSEAEQGSHVATTAVHQESNSSFSSHSISMGGELVRNDLHVTLDGEQAEASLHGLYLTAESQHVDNHLQVSHLQPNTNSRQVYKGVLDGASRAVFNGRIVVARNAQKVDAKQSNRNLLLSRKAQVHSNPQLEIFADDVRCTHGSTVGQLDPEALFYLRSRGIARQAAEQLLTHAFANEVVETINVTPVREAVQTLLGQRLGGGKSPQEVI
jgi:Fe-S cluster assembly protein SufD